jgi:hypothetical protein
MFLNLLHTSVKSVEIDTSAISGEVTFIFCYHTWLLSLFLWQWYVPVSIVADNLLFQASLVHGILNGHRILHLSFTRKVLPVFFVIACTLFMVCCCYLLSPTSLCSRPLLRAHVFLSAGHTVSRTQLTRQYVYTHRGFNELSAPNRQAVGGFWG